MVVDALRLTRTGGGIVWAEDGQRRLVRASQTRMKSTLTIIVAVVVALVVGFFAGQYQAGREWNSYYEAYLQTRASNDVHFWVRALYSLRRGEHTNAMEFMESCLDGSLLTFVTYEKLRPEERNEAAARAIQVARDYRSRHPWQSRTPEIREGVERVLAVTK